VKRILLLVTIVFLVLGFGLIGCDTSTSSGGKDDGEDQTVEVQITNGLQYWDIWYVFCTLSSDDSWGDDLLGDQILAPGYTLTFEVTPGTYDIQCIDEDLDTYTRWQIEIGSNGYAWTVTLEDLDQ